MAGQVSVDIDSGRTGDTHEGRVGGEGEKNYRREG